MRDGIGSLYIIKYIIHLKKVVCGLYLGLLLVGYRLYLVAIILHKVYASSLKAKLLPPKGMFHSGDTVPP